ncbi:hypothetical protein F7725_025730 [Dissostichus mawsoni]|uniref:Uncharacterized protein n=1 Tax=Dissostichus mawsoni TaxID=36200 RepID=A0A7J5X528_DISMA|nr:hypothetical protein F7725_025730 [Dissostichus mawsoni]
MVGRRDEDSAEAMIDVTYRQSAAEREVVFVLQRLYLTRLRAVVLDPEVVFVASLMKADAPALVASFQCDFSLQLEEDGRQDMRANLRELRVLACPFIRDQEDAAVTTVRSHDPNHHMTPTIT